MALNQVTYDRETDPRACHVSPGHLAERLEHTRTPLSWYTRPGVIDSHTDFIFASLRFDDDSPTAVLYCVVEQVEHDLLKRR